MSSYFRFPETEVIQERFWGCRPRNPTCGVISLELGTKCFAWGNMIYGACLAICCVLILLSPLYLSHKDEQNILHDLKRTSINNKDMEWIEKIYLNKAHGFLQALLFISFLMFSGIWYSSWKLKNAVVKRDLNQLKRYFFVLFLFVILVFVPTVVETEYMWSKAILIDIPCFILEVMGLLFTHAFIVSLISPDISSNDDLNRIQFNP